MNLAVFVKLSNKKLMDKLFPLLESKIFDKIFVIRSFYGPNHPNIEYMKIPKLGILKNKYFSTIYVGLRGFFYLLKIKPQLIITYYFIPHGLFGLIFGKILRKKVISCIIGTDMIYFKKRFGNNIFKKLLSYSNKIISTGSNSQLELRKILYPYNVDDKVRIIPNTIKIKKVNLKKIFERPYQFIFVGKLDRNKRIEIIIKSFRLFLDNSLNNKKYSLLILGEGPLLKDMIPLGDRLNLSNNCKFLGFQKRVTNFYKESRFIILASKSEGLPAVLVEGMYHGCIPITTMCGDIGDLVNSSNGFMISNDLNRKDLIKKLSQKLIEVTQLPDEELLKRSENCIKTSYEYTYENGGEKWKEIIKSLI